MDEVKHHDSDARSQKGEDSARLPPLRSQENENQVFSHQGQVGAEAHANKRRNPNRAEQITPILGPVVPQPA